MVWVSHKFYYSAFMDIACYIQFIFLTFEQFTSWGLSVYKTITCSGAYKKSKIKYKLCRWIHTPLFSYPSVVPDVYLLPATDFKLWRCAHFNTAVSLELFSKIGNCIKIEFTLRTGQHYYLNVYTKESQWDRPEKPAEPVSSGGPDQVQCSHLLVKHQNSRRPSSWREDEITRTKEEALDLVKCKC